MYKVNARYLVKPTKPFTNGKQEVKVIELSPSSKYVKFKKADGSFSWETADEWKILEELV